MNARQRLQIPQTRAYKNAQSAARRIATAKDKGRVAHTWAKHMHAVIQESRT